MVRLTNKQTGGEVIIYGVRNISGQVVAIDKVGERYINAHNAELIYTGINADGVQTFAVNDGFELLTKTTKKRKPVTDSVHFASKPESKPETNNAKKEYFVPFFNDALEDLNERRWIYMYGAAGSGKSHTAEQFAKALGVKFYGQTTVQFAHDVRGYGDASGNLVTTPFYQAFVHGGLYFQDEYDRSFEEAMIVLNSALANGWYDFPVVGRKQAHKDFIFIAAGNTQMTGATDGYVAAREQDLSCIDRFACFYKCTYSHEVELNAIAKGDADLVAFIEATRRALNILGSQPVVSYRTTSYLATRAESSIKRQKALIRSTFKTLDIDQLHNILATLKNDSQFDMSNVWFKDFANAIKNYQAIQDYTL